MHPKDPDHPPRIEGCNKFPSDRMAGWSPLLGPQMIQPFRRMGTFTVFNYMSCRKLCVHTMIRTKNGKLPLKTGWWFQTCFYFHPENWEGDSHFDEHIFSIGLVQPPTRKEGLATDRESKKIFYLRSIYPHPTVKEWYITIENFWAAFKTLMTYDIPLYWLVNRDPGSSFIVIPI